MKILRLKQIGFVLFCLALGWIQTATAQDFTFTIEPSSLTLVPGQSASFVVSLTPLDGFTNEVTLSVSNLVSGVTATFSPQTLTPPGTSLLTLNATTNAANGSFMLDLIAAGGGITNMATSSVSVSFGLLPICYGAFEGIITDAETGLPVTNAAVQAGNGYATTDSNGFYLITNLTLSGSENLPAYYAVMASDANYWPSSADAYAVCDATNIVNLKIDPVEYGSISGVLTSEGGQPMTNVTILAEYQYEYSATTDTNGFYQFKSLPLANDNAPADYSLFTSPAGYWEVTSNTIVQANSNSVVNLVAIPICYATVTGSVVYNDTGLPASNVYVTISTSGSFSTTTDSSGDFSATNVTLGFDNVPVTASIQSSAPGYYTAYTNVLLSNCDVTVGPFALGLPPVPPPPPDNYGSVAGHVYDLQTGLAITNANVDGYSTSTNGSYLITNIFVGTGTTTNVFESIYAVATGYFESVSNVEIDANETTIQDLYLLRIGYGGVEGTVLNSATGLPVSGVYVSIGGGQTTGANGQYSSGPLSLGADNAPTYESFYASEIGYWMTYTNTTITNGVTNIVNIELIQICTGATIVGNVVNALTQQAITNATIAVSGGNYQTVMTDTNGDFIVTNVVVGNDNSPIQTTLTATAPGFNPQTKTLTIFCDATISTEFGAPETAFGAIDGFVTNAVTGQPLTNVFIGSSFGGATTTDTNGYYILQQAPLGANGSNRTWTVTAGPVTIGTINYPAQTKSVIVSSNTTNQLNFGFGQPPTELVISGTGSPEPVTVGSNLVYAIRLTNAAAAADNVVISDTLPPNVTFVSASITNDTGGIFSAPALTNGVVTTMATNFGADSAVVLLITVTPTAPGMLTNVATVTSQTPDVNPSGTNHSTTIINTAVAPIAPPLFADLGVTMTGVPNPVLVSNQLTYTLTVTNSGPTNAPAVVLTDSLPASVTFGSATVSQGSYILIPDGVEWTLGPVNVHGSASATIVILPLMTGEVTNTATVSITPTTPPVTDTNLANNTASVIVTVTELTLTNITIQAGPITFNPQTGLYQQTVQVNNLGAVAATAVRVSVLGMPANVALYNATGMTDGTPYVEYDQPVAAGGNVVFLLEYYEASRAAFTSTNFTATVVAAVTVPAPSGTFLQLDRTPFLSEGQLTIEFASVPGHTYVVQYSSDMLTWLTATPPISATNTLTQWIDAGAPETASPPGSPGQRFYRIVQTH